MRMVPIRNKVPKKEPENPKRGFITVIKDAFKRVSIGGKAPILPPTDPTIKDK